MEKILSNPRMVILAIALIVVAGLGAIQNLPRSEDPEMTNRHATVITYFPGASTERVEALILEPLEQVLREIPEVSHLDSTARAGIGTISIELVDSIANDTESDEIWSQARDKIARIGKSLPQGASTPVLDSDRSYAFTWIAGFTWQGQGDDVIELNRHAKELASRLSTLSGTAQVQLYGEPHEEIRVDIDPVKIASLGLDANAIGRRIAETDAKVSAGELHNPQHRMSLEVSGAFQRIQDIRDLPLLVGDYSSSVRLQDIASVYRAERQPAKSFSYVDGQRSVVIAVRMESQERGDYWSEKIRREVDEFRDDLPSEVVLKELFVQEKYNQQRIGELMDNILLGFFMIVGVLWLTLGWRAALITASALPLTTLFSLACMQFIGLPIHQMSVTGLIVALGIMVDNAIVVADTVSRYRREGMNPVRAAVKAVSHLWLPLAGSTLTTVLTFMPLVLMPGSTGEFIGGIALAVIGSLIGSWIISLFIIAPLASRFLKQSSGHGLSIPAAGRFYAWSLGQVLKVPRLTMLLVMLLPVTGFILANKLPEQFFPVSDRDMLNLELYLPSAAGIESTRLATERISELIHKEEGVTGLNWFIGSSSPSYYYNLLPGNDGAQNYAQAMISTQHFSDANRLVKSLQRELDAQFPEYQVILRRLEQGPPAKAPVELRLSGSDLFRLKEVGEEIRRLALQTEDVIHVRATLNEVVPKVWVDIDPVKSRLGGLGQTDVSAKLQSDLSGAEYGSLLEATEQLPVLVRVAGISAIAVDELELLPMSLPGGPRPLMALADMSIKPVPAQITRRDGKRVNTLMVYIRDGVLPSVVLNRVQDAIKQSNLELPAGIKLDIGGESENRNEALSELLSSVSLIAVLMLVTVLMSFNSFRFSLVIFAVAGQAAGLGMLSLALSGFAFGFTAIIALMGLIGLAINAAIIILSELKVNPRAMVADKAAIVESTASCTRHITSTTITTVVGLMPLILAEGGFWPPFAIVLAGGTAFATVLSLYFVPAAFLVLRKPFLLQVLSSSKHEESKPALKEAV